jgi:hypothetical protein
MMSFLHKYSFLSPFDKPLPKVKLNNFSAVEREYLVYKYLEIKEEMGKELTKKNFLSRSVNFPFNNVLN